MDSKSQKSSSLLTIKPGKTDNTVDHDESSETFSAASSIDVDIKNNHRESKDDKINPHFQGQNEDGETDFRANQVDVVNHCSCFPYLQIFRLK